MEEKVFTRELFLHWLVLYEKQGVNVYELAAHQ